MSWLDFPLEIPGFGLSINEADAAEHLGTVVDAGENASALEEEAALDETLLRVRRICDRHHVPTTEVDGVRFLRIEDLDRLKEMPVNALV